MADEAAKAVYDTETKSCPEGYTHVFGPLCVEKTTLKKIDDIVPDVPDLPNLEDINCEMALKACRQAAQMVRDALAMPRKLADQAKRLMNKPFDIAAQAAKNALSAIDDVNNMINDVLSGAAGPISDLRNALQRAMQCPVIAASPAGALIEQALDIMDAGGNPGAILQQLKGAMMGAALEQIEALKKTPAEALDNAQKMMDDMLDRMGVGEMLKTLQMLEQCVGSACDVVKVAQRIPESAEKMMEKVNGFFDEGSGKFKAIVMKPVTAVEQAACEATEVLAKAKNAVKTTT